MKSMHADQFLDYLPVIVFVEVPLHDIPILDIRRPFVFLRFRLLFLVHFVDEFGAVFARRLLRIEGDSMERVVV